MNKRVQMACAYCGSTFVVRDATAYWDFAEQKWELSDPPSDVAYCEDCGGETTIIEKEIESGA